MTDPIKIDIWSDIACPWCYIGKRHLEAGIAGLGENAPDIEIEYHSFELAPDTPVDFEGSEIDFLAAHKGMPEEQVRQMLGHVSGVAKAAGLDYDFDALKHTKTLKAHELLHFAKEHGAQLALKERLLSAYFTEGGHVGRIDELVGFAAEVGLDADAAREALESGRYAAAVQADIAQAGAYGIQGVPFFVFDGKYGVSGAQPAEVFGQVITQVGAERSGEAA
ncbi:DsbA family oxidoreductase [Agromyces archimandritae]|uniref:DsbA family oxidoreductase n=1 Tax=Agromyces archimandritae TaxID=2781962 RepID=A0A975FMI5_9MICO|nr:DsbA family oxidoreductase [Agromyces archimandritae]QTX04854.1 DsbA family oxidoreductase [Agromyces archimandritae]